MGEKILQRLRGFLENLMFVVLILYLDRLDGFIRVLGKGLLLPFAHFCAEIFI